MRVNHAEAVQCGCEELDGAAIPLGGAIQEISTEAGLPKPLSAGQRIGQRCQDLAKQRGWDARNLAEKAGISLAVAVLALSDDAGKVRLDALGLIAEAFACQPEFLCFPFPALREE